MKSCRLLVFLAVALAAPVAGVAAESAAAVQVPAETAGGYLGVLLEPVPEAIRAQLGGVLPSGQGVMIRDVREGTPAAKAGFRAYDVVIDYGNQKLFSPEQLRRLVQADRPDATITLRFVRGATVHEVPVTLGKAISQAERRQSGMRWMPGLRAPIRPLASPADRVTTNWESFDSLSLRKLQDGNFQADIQYLAEDGKLVKQTFSGSHEAIRGQIMNNLPPVERERLLDALSARGDFFPPGDPNSDFFYVPPWFNWPSD